SEAAHVGKVAALLAGSSLLLGIRVGAEGASAPTNTSQTLAICVEHLGASDKPVFPLVIAAARPSPESLRTLLKTDMDPDFVRVVIVRESEARHLVKTLCGVLERGELAASNRVGAVLQVTLVQSSSSLRATQTFHLEGASVILTELEHFQPSDAGA